MRAVACGYCWVAYWTKCAPAGWGRQDQHGAALARGARLDKPKRREPLGPRRFFGVTRRRAVSLFVIVIVQLVRASPDLLDEFEENEPNHASHHGDD